jgi:hypothetical protein
MYANGKADEGRRRAEHGSFVTKSTYAHVRQSEEVEPGLLQAVGPWSSGQWHLVLDQLWFKIFGREV